MNLLKNHGGALLAGALAVLRLPPGIGHPGYAAAAQELIRTVKLMSEIKVVRRFARPASTGLVAAPSSSAAGPGKPMASITCLPPGSASPVTTLNTGWTRGPTIRR